MWRAWTGSWDADAYAAHLLRTAVRQLRETPGNVAACLLRRSNGGQTEFTLLSVWESMDAVRAMVGEDVEQVEPHGTDARFVVQIDAAAIHYEVADACLGERMT